MSWLKKNKKAEVPPVVLSADQTASLLREIVHEKEKELVYNMVQCWIWIREAADPKTTGKYEAEQFLGQYQKRNKELEGQILTFKTYAEENNLSL